jgi:hypothetical protein
MITMRTDTFTYALAKAASAVISDRANRIEILHIVIRPRSNWFMPVTHGGLGEI